MRALIIVSLYLCVACKAAVRSPVSDLHAVTDGMVTLGVVPSENEEGLQAYRLLLCKKSAVYDTATFTDRTKCLPALLDDAGQEVVLFSNNLRRGFAAKYFNYAKIAASVALVAGGVYAGHRWFTKGAKHIDRLASRADEALQIKKSELQELYDKEILRIKEHLDDFKGLTDEADKVEQELQEAFKEADREALEKVLIRIENIDKKMAEGLRIRLTHSFYNPKLMLLGEEGGVISEAPRINAELLEDFAKRVEKSDKIFAARLRQEKFAPRAITNSDLYYFGNLYRDAAQMFNREVQEKLTRVATGDRSLKLRRLTNAEQIISSTRIRKAETFAHVTRLRQYEMEKEILSQLSEGKLSVADVKKNLQRLNADGSLDVDNHLERVENLFNRSGVAYNNISHSFFSSTDSVDISKARKFLADITEEKALLGQSLPTIEKIHKIAAHREALRMYETGSFNLKSALSEVDGKISNTYHRLYNAETYPFHAPDAGRILSIRELRFWDEIMKLKETDTSELRLQSLKKEIDLFETKLQASNAEFEGIDDLIEVQRGVADKFKEMVTEHRDNVVERLREAVQAIEDGNTARVQELKQAAAKERQAWGLSGLAAGLGATAALTSLDKSIWGHGEKQLGSYWSQIFSDKASFADATLVGNMQAVLNKLAEVFGHKVNTAALQLAK